MCRITCARNDSGTQGTGGDTAEQPASDDNMLVQTASFRGDISANENVDLEFIVILTQKESICTSYPLLDADRIVRKRVE